MDIVPKLHEIAKRLEELTAQLSDPSVIADRSLFLKISRERAEIEPVVDCFQRWLLVQSEISGNQELIESESDRELVALAREELAPLQGVADLLEKEMKVLLLPKDPNDEKNIILELRAGTGGDEAALFAADLFNMYSRYSEARRWKVEILSHSEAAVGGFKECIARIEGAGAFSVLKFERGVHRVQRVPQTETQGRIHTSTVTVAVLPEAEDVDISIEDKELRIDVFRASGPGGQCVNTTDSAVRITHIPSGIVVTCQDEKSQHKNKAKAMTVLKSRLLDARQAQQDAERRDDRRSQIGSGERSEKIRTYNFPQGRITDHRIGLTVYQLETVINGKLELLVDPLISHYQAEALQSGATI